MQLAVHLPYSSSCRFSDSFFSPVLHVVVVMPPVSLENAPCQVHDGVKCAWRAGRGAGRRRPMYLDICDVGKNCVTRLCDRHNLVSTLNQVPGIGRASVARTDATLLLAGGMRTDKNHQLVCAAVASCHQCLRWSLPAPAITARRSAPESLLNVGMTR
jgi:hypothetical protein